MDSVDRLANRHFLVVDDEDFVRNLIVRFLTQSGASGVVEATDGRQAIEAIQSYDMTFDAVISDIHMEPMNGLQLLYAIRTGAGGLKRNLPVLLLSAYGHCEFVTDALALDADAFVLKPVGRDALVDRLVRVFDRNVAICPAQTYAAVPIEPQAPPLPKLDPAPPTKPLVITVGGAFGASSASTPGAPAKPRERGSVRETDSREKRVAICEVKPGSVLTQDVYIGDPPKLLLAAPAILTRATLDRLEDLRQVHDSYNALYVIEPTR
jgi:CheY-like chemotaxis protein